MNLNPIINNFQRSIRKVQICCIFILSCTACSLNIPYENQYSDPDAITTVTANYWHRPMMQFPSRNSVYPY